MNPLNVDDIREAITNTITISANNSTRSLQKQIGPSEVGEPCSRKLAYKLMSIPHATITRDPWRSIIGISGHAWLAEAFEEANTRLGFTRWIVEERVTINEHLAGSCDIYDANTNTVLDWKIVGPSAMKKYRKGPSEQYRTQVHLYALGHVNAGRAVDDVGIVFLPQAGQLDDMLIHVEPYDPVRAREAVDRVDALRALTNGVTDPVKASQILNLIPKTPAIGGCRYCSWQRDGSNDLLTGCPGDGVESNWIAGLETIPTIRKARL